MARMLPSDMINEMITKFKMPREVIAKTLGVGYMTVFKWSYDRTYPNQSNEDNIRILYSMLIKGKGIRKELIIKNEWSEDIFDRGIRIYPKKKRR